MTVIDQMRRSSRLLDDTRSLTASFSDHLIRFGQMPTVSANHAESFIAEIHKSGLLGRGGASFPSAKKIASTRARSRRLRLVVNAMEGEPASAKDRILLRTSPHLVLDGAQILASALGATSISICVPNDRSHDTALMAHALSERSTLRETVPVEIQELTARYIAGEETALIAALSGGDPLPSFRPDKTVPVHLGRDTLLVHNVETVANFALIARFGGEWFREIGTRDAPGSCLVTLSGDVEHPGVVEIEIGTPIQQILDRAHPEAEIQAVLVGGYGGTWIAPKHFSTPFSPNAMRSIGTTMGPGIFIALSSSGCGLRETERIAHFMAAESAGQCGPCLFGLPAIANDLKLIADGSTDRAVLERLHRRCGEVDGRGACRHPDGVVRLVRSALRVFESDVQAHINGAPCTGSHRSTVLILPNASKGNK